MSGKKRIKLSDFLAADAGMRACSKSTVVRLAQALLLDLEVNGNMSLAVDSCSLPPAETFAKASLVIWPRS